MHFLRARLSEDLGGVPIYDPDNNSDAIAAAVKHVTGWSIKKQLANVAIPTLAAGRTWSMRFSDRTGSQVSIRPCPGQAYAMSFGRQQLDTQLAAALGVYPGTTQVEILCDLPVSDGGHFRLNTDWLIRLFEYFGLHSPQVPDGNTLGEHLKFGDTHGAILHFTDQARSIQLSIDDRHLGPYADGDGKRIRSSGFGYLQGLAFASTRCHLRLVLADTSGFAFDGHQLRLRERALQMSAYIGPQG